MLSSLLKERFLFIGLAVAVIAYASEHTLLDMGRLPVLIAAFALIVAIILVSTRIAHHAEILASKVGDPYGTMILTLSAVMVEVVVLAIKGADESVKEKIFKNMSKRAAEMLRDDLEAKGPVRLSEVEGAQKEILAIARRLAEAGELVLGGKGAVEYV